MILKGKAHKFGDDINTDYIIANRYKLTINDEKEFIKHFMEDIDSNFYKKIKKGDFVVGGENFGCGSSRETAPLIVAKSGIAAVIAKSFSRIFFRNSINIGLPVIECNTDLINDQDQITVDIDKGVITTPKNIIQINSIPKVMRKILLSGGLVDYVKQFNDNNDLIFKEIE